MRTLICAACALFLLSCGDKTKEETTTTESTDTAKIDYAYTIENPDNWEWGSKENTRIVLQSLKHFENGNIDETVKAFADTVTVKFDNFEATLSRAQLAKMFKDQLKGIKKVTIKMEDFESVKAKKGDAEYVSLWYKQINEDLKGKKNSVSVMDDMKMKNGLIVELDEKTRHYAKKK